MKKPLANHRQKSGHLRRCFKAWQDGEKISISAGMEDGRAGISGDQAGWQSDLRFRLLATYSGVRENLRLIKDANERQVRGKCRLTVKELLTLWLEQSQGKGQRIVLCEICHNCEQTILPWIGNELVSSLTAKKLAGFLELKEKSGRLDGRGGLFQKNRKDIAVIIKSALKLVAVDYGYVIGAGSESVCRSPSRGK